MKQVLVGVLAVIGAATIVVILAMLMGVYGVFPFVRNTENIPPRGVPEEIGCTMEAKICPDGSAVGRSGPQCEFAPCPAVAATNENIRVVSPAPNDVIKSPLRITGEARGTWFFEGGFPISLIAENGMPVASGVAQAKGEWMTTDFVSFEAMLTFAVPHGMTSGSLVLSKDNPSGLPEHDDTIMIPIHFSGGE